MSIPIVKSVYQREPIRLSCLWCSCECEGIEKIPDGWTEVKKIRSYSNSVETDEDILSSRGETLFDWETHTGVCPDCAPF